MEEGVSANQNLGLDLELGFKVRPQSGFVVRLDPDFKFRVLGLDPELR